MDRPAPPLPPTAYVVLGMLRLGAQSGYDIKQAVDISTRFFWSISEAQLYPTLADLEEKGLIEGRDAPRGKRKRRVYEVTPTGETALKRWLSREEALSFEVRDVAMLKLFFADAVDDDQGVALVAQMRTRSEATLEHLRPQLDSTFEETGDEDPPRFPGIALRLGIAVHESIIAALHDFEAELERRG